MFIISIIKGKIIINYTLIILEDIRKEYYINKYNAELIKEKVNKNLLINNNFANLSITKIFPKKVVFINNILKHLNKSIPIKSFIIKGEILFNYLI